MRSRRDARVDNEEIRKKIEEAKQLVGGDPQDPFIQIAFKEVFHLLLSESTPYIVKERKGNNAGYASNMPISEFLAQRRIKTETDKVVAIIYHQFQNEQVSSTSSEILEAYNVARIKRPSNLSDVIARCIRKGHIIETSEKKNGQKTWQITQSGERYVEEDLRPEPK